MEPSPQSSPCGRGGRQAPGEGYLAAISPELTKHFYGIASLTDARLVSVRSTMSNAPKTMVDACIILADSSDALIELCGISILERLLRTLQRCEIKRAIVLSSTKDVIAREVA